MVPARVILIIGVCCLAARAAPPPADPDDDLFAPLPAPAHADAKKVELGRRLFFEKRLAKDASISCATCHPLTGDSFGTVAGVRFLGNVGGVAATNTPTVFNAPGSFRQGWGGAVRTLRDVATRPIASQMGWTVDDALRVLNADAAYRHRFAESYGAGPVTRRQLADVLAVYMEHIVPRDAPFDRWLSHHRQGDELSPEAKKGYGLFVSYGCASCHQGRMVGGNMLARFGVFKDYADEPQQRTVPDTSPASGLQFFVSSGEHPATMPGGDRFVFRVPSLRNVEKTAPYFHDGSAATLPDAVRTMARYQLGRELSDTDVGAIVTFLGSLTATTRVPEAAPPVEP